jgi:hypothetical protein
LYYRRSSVHNTNKTKTSVNAGAQQKQTLAPLAKTILLVHFVIVAILPYRN